MKLPLQPDRSEITQIDCVLHLRGGIKEFHAGAEEMSSKSIKVKVLGPSGEWIAGQGESVGEATRDAMAKAKESKRKTGKQKRRKKV